MCRTNLLAAGSGRWANGRAAFSEAAWSGVRGRSRSGGGRFERQCPAQPSRRQLRDDGSEPITVAIFHGSKRTPRRVPAARRKAQRPHLLGPSCQPDCATARRSEKSGHHRPGNGAKGASGCSPADGPFEAQFLDEPRRALLLAGEELDSGADAQCLTGRLGKGVDFVGDHLHCCGDPTAMSVKRACSPAIKAAAERRASGLLRSPIGA